MWTSKDFFDALTCLELYIRREKQWDTFFSHGGNKQKKAFAGKALAKSQKELDLWRDRAVFLIRYLKTQGGSETMKASEFLGGYLKPADIDRPWVVTIVHVAMETIGRGDGAEEKGVIYFREFKKGLPLNSTNTQKLIDILRTDETDNWRDRAVELFVDPTVEYGGKPVGGLRFRSPAQIVGAQTAESQAAAERAMGPISKDQDWTEGAPTSFDPPRR